VSAVKKVTNQVCYISLDRGGVQGLALLQLLGIRIEATGADWQVVKHTTCYVLFPSCTTPPQTAARPKVRQKNHPPTCPHIQPGHGNLTSLSGMLYTVGIQRLSRVGRLVAKLNLPNCPRLLPRHRRKTPKVGHTSVLLANWPPAFDLDQALK
jgi:hypothetical protein